jgi:RHS repeat-associated protein
MTTYAYNGDGDRVSQTVDGTLTTYVLDVASPLTMVLAETTGADTVYYLHGLDLIAQSDGTNTEYFLYDGLGSVRQLADDWGQPSLSLSCDPYGSVYAESGAAETGFGFTGEQTGENGLLFLRARYYASGMGRFLNADPSRMESNPYGYASGSPVMFTDPSGLNGDYPCAPDDVLCQITYLLSYLIWPETPVIDPPVYPEWEPLDPGLPRARCTISISRFVSATGPPFPMSSSDPLFCPYIKSITEQAGAPDFTGHRLTKKSTSGMLIKR